jgi:hypothetical protein
MITASMTVNKSQYPSVGSFSLTSDRGLPLTVFQADVPLGPAEMGDDITFRYGYAEPVEWKGSVLNTVKGGDLMTVYATSLEELKLLNTLYCESFIDETAEAIVRSALSSTGLPLSTIDTTGAQLARFTADTIPVWLVVRQVEVSLLNGHGLSGYCIWLGAEGLTWTRGDRPGDVPEIVTGKNLIDHAPSDTGLSQVTTFMLPGLTHSQCFSIEDTRREISGTYRIERVEHELHDVQARTHIFYRRGA